MSVSCFTGLKRERVWIVFVHLTTLISDVTVDCWLLTAGGTSAQFSLTDSMLESSPLGQQITCSAQYSNLSKLQCRSLGSCFCTILSVRVRTDNMSALPAGKPEMISTATRSNAMQFWRMSVLLWSTWTPCKNNICLCPTRLELSMRPANSSWKSRWGAGSHLLISWLSSKCLNCPVVEYFYHISHLCGSLPNSSPSCSDMGKRQANWKQWE